KPSLRLRLPRHSVSQPSRLRNPRRLIIITTIITITTTDTLASLSRRSAPPTLTPDLRLLLEAPARRGQLGLACASRTSLRLEITSNGNQKLNGPCVCRCKGRFPVKSRAYFMAAKSLPFAPVPPQALPKFNPRKQPLRPIPNELFTGHSREKQEPRITTIV